MKLYRHSTGSNIKRLNGGLHLNLENQQNHFNTNKVTFKNHNPSHLPLPFPTFPKAHIHTHTQKKQTLEYILSTQLTNVWRASSLRTQILMHDKHQHAQMVKKTGPKTCRSLTKCCCQNTKPPLVVGIQAFLG